MRQYLQGSSFSNVSKFRTCVCAAKLTIILCAGLEPSDVRNAHEEFRKFDMESNGELILCVTTFIVESHNFVYRE